MLMTLAALALILTCTMFFTKNHLLGYPSAMFWAVFGGYCYLNYTVLWDSYYLTFFASLGMTIFCMLAMYALRKSDLAHTDVDKQRYLTRNPPAPQRSARTHVTAYLRTICAKDTAMGRKQLAQVAG